MLMKAQRLILCCLERPDLLEEALPPLLSEIVLEVRRVKWNATQLKRRGKIDSDTAMSMLYGAVKELIHCNQEQLQELRVALLDYLCTARVSEAQLAALDKFVQPQFLSGLAERSAVELRSPLLHVRSSVVDCL